MKKFATILSIIMTMALLLTAVSVAAADTTYTLTINKEEAGRIYEAYQITEATLQQLRAYSDGKNAYLVEFLEEMERKMPTSMLLMSAVCDEQGVTMNIVTPGLEEANVVIKQLRSFESIKQMTISTITENIDEGGVSSATFSIRCSYFGAADENVDG